MVRQHVDADARHVAQDLVAVEIDSKGAEGGRHGLLHAACYRRSSPPPEGQRTGPPYLTVNGTRYGAPSTCSNGSLSGYRSA